MGTTTQRQPAATLPREGTMNASTTFTSKVICDCGCGESVEMIDGGFSATEVTIGGCSRRRAAGAFSFQVRKSAGLRFQSADAGTVSHRDGLVSFG